MTSTTKFASIKRFIRGDSRILLTSAPFNWSGLAIEQHDASPGERAESTIDHHLLILVHGPAPSSVDRASVRGGIRAAASAAGRFMHAFERRDSPDTPLV